jgi:hypothetical protein
METFGEIVDLWNENKITELSDKGIDAMRTFLNIRAGLRYAVWGTGNYSHFMMDKIKSVGAKAVCAIDAAPDRIGCDFYGLTIQAPEALKGSVGDFDRVLIASFDCYAEIKRSLVEMGIGEDRITAPAAW